MPAKIVALGRELGLKNPVVYIKNGLYATVLRSFYSTALNEARLAGIQINEQEMPPLQNYQRALKVMAVMKVIGLHYVMMRPDGSYMDPVDGEKFSDFQSLKSPWMKSYEDTGISIVFDPEWVNLKPLLD